MIDNSTGNHTGFMVSLFNKLSVELGFHYSIKFEEDAYHRKQTEIGDGEKWKNLIRMLKLGVSLKKLQAILQELHFILKLTYQVYDMNLVKRMNFLCNITVLV